MQGAFIQKYTSKLELLLNKNDSFQDNIHRINLFLLYLERNLTEKNYTTLSESLIRRLEAIRVCVQSEVDLKQPKFPFLKYEKIKSNL